MNSMLKGAEFSPCRNYRYQLYRIWDEDKPKAMCIGLNPSTANAESNDPTIESLIRILTHNGYGGLYMVNLFALISPYPEDLRKCPDPVKDNDRWLRKTRELCSDVIYCWGNFKQVQYRVKHVTPWFTSAKCFGKNKNGSPKHPLYLKKDCSLQLFNP
jgi:hypothetical protein